MKASLTVNEFAKEGKFKKLWNFLTPPIWQKLWNIFENISYSMVWSKDPMYDPGDIPGSRVIGSNLSPVSCVVKLLGKIHPCSVHNVFLPLFGLRKAFKKKKKSLTFVKSPP